MFEQFIQSFIDQITAVTNPQSRIYVLYLITALLLAFVVYLQVESAHRKEALAEGHELPEKTGFLRYIFDPKVWLHPSSLQDMRYFAVNAAVYYALISQFLLSSHTLSNWTHSVFVSWFGTVQTPALDGPLAVTLYTFVSVLALDFGVFLAHYVFHKAPVLWHFHKVHHSAEELNPMTLFRMHPLDLFLTGFVVMLFQSIAFAGFFFLTAAEPSVFKLFGLNIVVFLFYLFGYNLRHSHIWLNYPVWLSKFLISPAQHQIHHSSDPKHFDHNFGLIFSFWDRLFGTHYIPIAREKLTYGLSREEPNPFKSIVDIYFKPFQWAWSNAKQAFALRHNRYKAYGVTFVIVVGAGALSNQASQGRIAAGPSLPDLRLAHLTWTEIDAALDRGYTTVIVPTGGTEQNGPFVVLGKHNFIMEVTSQKVAQKLGNTLVAPVIDYVPEGQIEPKLDGHMRFAGTLSLPEPVFEQLLNYTARSLKAHGFKTILFMGDSLGNQEAQAKVADTLTFEWKEDKVLVHSLSDYYSANGQFDYLLKQGYSEAEIGYHAGMRDGSEMLAIYPQGVRILAQNILKNRETGMSGDIQKASSSIGEKMLQLKITAAVNQARRLFEVQETAHLSN